MRSKNKRRKAPVYIAAFFILAVNLLVALPASEDISIKELVCGLFGCYGGSRPCLEIGWPPLSFSCYENPPMN